MHTTPSKKSHHQVTMLPLASLQPHPQNANVMNPDRLKKLKKHIADTGRYEPLIVRPHPDTPDAYQLINGHHRKQVLQSLGYKDAACLVWHLDDKATLILLATINRLSGNDAAGKRLTLLETLARDHHLTPADLAAALPEDEKTLQQALAMDVIKPPMAVIHPPQDMLEAFTIFLHPADKKRLLHALHQTAPDAARALLQWLDERAAPLPPRAA